MSQHFRMIVGELGLLSGSRFKFTAESFVFHSAGIGMLGEISEPPRAVLDGVVLQGAPIIQSLDFADLRDHIQQLTDEHKRRERQLMDENASLLKQFNAAQAELRDGVGKVQEKAAAREAEIAERLAALLGNVNLACYGVDDLVGRLRDELADLDWMGSAKRMAGG